MMILARLLVLISCLAFLASCQFGTHRYICWAQQQFMQASSTEADTCSVSTCHEADFVRRADVYDGFNTVGHYDVLWYSSQVRATHIEQLAQRSGRSSEAIDQQLRDTYQEDRNTLTFYVLSSGGNTESMRPRIAKKPSEQNTSMWSIVLRIGEDEYAPCSIKKTLLPTDLIYCFGDRYDFHFRDTYCVTFTRRVCKRDVLNTCESMTLILRNVHYCVSFSWDETLVANAYQSTLLNPFATIDTAECQPETESSTRSPMSVQEIRI